LCPLVAAPGLAGVVVVVVPSFVAWRIAGFAW
jgi:hypothetical protein